MVLSLGTLQTDHREKILLPRKTNGGQASHRKTSDVLNRTYSPRITTENVFPCLPKRIIDDPKYYAVRGVKERGVLARVGSPPPKLIKRRKGS